MKTKILKWSFALAVVVAAGYTAYSSQNEIQLSGVSIDNVEALASGESYNPLCPNGCSGEGPGCYCYGWHDDWREAGSNL